MDQIKSREAILMRKNDAINMDMEETHNEADPVQFESVICIASIMIKIQSQLFHADCCAWQYPE